MYSRFFLSPSTDTRKAVFYLDVASARSERHSHGAKTYSTAWKAVKAELILVRHVKTRVLRNRFSRIVCAKNGYFVASVDRIVIAARAGQRASWTRFSPRQSVADAVGVAQHPGVVERDVAIEVNASPKDDPAIICLVLHCTMKRPCRSVCVQARYKLLFHYP